MPKILRMAGTDLFWELEDSADLAPRGEEIETARSSNQFVTSERAFPARASSPI